MSERVPASQIEGLVGARRHRAEHIIRGDSPSGVAHILHPADCLARYDDLRECPWSLAFTRGEVWLPDDLPHCVRLRNGELIADMAPWGTPMAPLPISETCSWCYPHRHHGTTCPADIQTGTTKTPNPKPCPCRKGHQP